MQRPGVDPADNPRFDTQADRILARLKLRPMTNVELSAFGLNSRARISELRQAGHTIICDKGPAGISVYTWKKPASLPPSQPTLWESTV